MLLTKEEIELLPEEKRQVYLAMEKKLEGVSNLEKSDQDLKGLIQGAYKDPATLKKLQEVFKEAGIKHELPDHPVASFIKPLQDEIKELKKEKADDEKTRTKERLEKVFEETGIAGTKENYEKIDAFMKVNGIINLEYGIRQYAKTLEPEFPAVQYEHPFEFNNLPTEQEIKERTAREIRALNTQIGR
jgi:hypothetical protein